MPYQYWTCLTLRLELTIEDRDCLGLYAAQIYASQGPIATDQSAALASGTKAAAAERLRTAIEPYLL